MTSGNSPEWESGPSSEQNAAGNTLTPQDQASKDLDAFFSPDMIKNYVGFWGNISDGIVNIILAMYFCGDGATSCIAANSNYVVFFGMMVILNAFIAVIMATIIAFSWMDLGAEDVWALIVGK